MNELNSMLFALLRSVLSDKELDLSAFNGIDEERLEKLYKISKKHDLAHIVGAALDKAVLLTDSPTSKKFSKQQLLSVYRCENLDYELTRICDTLEMSGISYIPLKGAVIRRIYPEPWMRTSCDIDVLVHEEDIDPAVKALVDGLNYRTDGEKGYHDVSLFSDSGVHLELHFNIKENIKLLDDLLVRVWDYAKPTSEEGLQYELSREFFVFYILAHASYHFVRGGCGIRPFIDLWILNKHWDYDRQKVLDLCEKSGLLDFLEAAEELIGVWFEGNEHSVLTERIEKYLLFGGAFGVKTSQVAVNQGQYGGKLGYVRHRIFVSYDHLKAKYPSMKNKFWVPIYQVRRWFDGVREKKIKKSVRELRLNAELDKDTVNDLSTLMEELKLNKHIK